VPAWHVNEGGHVPEACSQYERLQPRTAFKLAARGVDEASDG
jgi:hypothetical protein